MAKSSTSFKKGNKASVGNNGGAPRKYDLIKEAQELEEWSKLPDSTAIYRFTHDKDYCADELDDFAAREPEFALAYKRAKERIGMHREEACNAGLMRDCVWNRSASIYHKQLKDHERAEKQFDADLKKKADAESEDSIIKKVREGIIDACQNSRTT